MKAKRDRRTEEAVRKRTQAEKHLAIADELDKVWPNNGCIDRMEARKLDKEAEALLKPEGPVAVRMGEVVPQQTRGIENNEAWLIADTLSDPNNAHVEASHTRAGLLLDVGCLSLGLDLSDTIQATNSVEKMMAHQMAACHIKAMELMLRVSNVPDQQAVPLANAAARLMSCYQQGYLALAKVRSGGRQVVVVQHVNVAHGGQAVVAGNMPTAGGGVQHGGKDEK